MQLIVSFLNSFMVKPAVCFIKFLDTWQDVCGFGSKILPITSLTSSVYDYFTK